MSTITVTPTKWIPKDAELLTEYSHLAEIYVYHSNGRACAISYVGRRAKHDVNYGFSNAEKREDWILRYTTALQTALDEKLAKRAAIKSFGNPLQMGDILNYHWGYEQTNQDFYQVIEVKGKSVVPPGDSDPPR